jgi:hypothetical protein
MVLSVSAHFGLEDERLERLAAHLLEQRMTDGGWNCRAWRGATHSSFHTTISVLEGLRDYELLNPESAPRLREAQARGREFLLVHRLFRAHRTGEVVKPTMLRFAFPPRWHYDVLCALKWASVLSRSDSDNAPLPCGRGSARMSRTCGRLPSRARKQAERATFSG